MDAEVFKAVPDLVDVCVPLPLVSRLIRLLDRVLVLVVVAIESVDGERILKAHRECLVLEREADKNVLPRMLGQLK